MKITTSVDNLKSNNITHTVYYTQCVDFLSQLDAEVKFRRISISTKKTSRKETHIVYDLSRKVHFKVVDLAKLLKRNETSIQYTHIRFHVIE